MEIGGLQMVLTPSDFLSPGPRDKVQIVNLGGVHWVTLSNIHVPTLKVSKTVLFST